MDDFPQPHSPGYLSRSAGAISVQAGRSSSAARPPSGVGSHRTPLCSAAAPSPHVSTTASGITSSTAVKGVSHTLDGMCVLGRGSGRAHRVETERAVHAVQDRRREPPGRRTGHARGCDPHLRIRRGGDSCSFTRDHMRASARAVPPAKREHEWLWKQEDHGLHQPPVETPGGPAKRHERYRAVRGTLPRY